MNQRQVPPEGRPDLDGAGDPRRHPQIQHSPLGDQVYNLLWDRIVRQQLGPGDKLSDLRLSEDLGVSRTPVREALHRLAQDGIVRNESRRGFYVASFSSQDVQEIYDIRASLEVLAVRKALPHLTDDALTAAQRALDEVSERVARREEGAGEAFLTVDREFHQMVVRAARNRRLTTLMGSLQAQIGVFQVYGTHLKPLVEESIEHHRVILAALQRRDGDAAARAMERHIEEVKSHMVAKFVPLQIDGDDANRTIDHIA